METTGDSYMMAAGLPGTAEEHAQSVTNMAFDMREVIEKKDTASDIDLEADLEVCTWRTTCNRKIPYSRKIWLFGGLPLQPPN